MKHLLKHTLLLLFIFAASLTFAQNSSDPNTHIVGAGETAYSISKTYGITKEQLRDANPKTIDANFQIKAGTRLIIPGKSSLAMKKKRESNSINIGIMLPLNKTKVGLAMTEYYRGVLMACEEMQKEKVNINIHAWDLSKDCNIDEILKEKEAAECDVIFGPFYAEHIEKLSAFTAKNKIRLAIPFLPAQNEIQNNSSIYTLSEFNPFFTEKTCERFINLFEKCNPIIIGCNDNKNAKGELSSAFRKYMEKRNIRYQMTSLESDMKSFAKAFKKNRENLIILNSSSIEKFEKAAEMIRQVKKEKPEIKVSTLGFHEWFKSEQSHKKELAENNVYIPTYFYYNRIAASTKKIESEYFKWFKRSMAEITPKLAIIGYDHTLFFLRGITRYGYMFDGNKAQTTGRHIQMPMHFKKVSENGGYRNEAFMFIHYKDDNSIESMAY